MVATTKVRPSDTTFAARALAFYRDLATPRVGPAIEVIEPHRDPVVLGLMEAFYHRFFGDRKPRIFAVGINPGRHGSGMTGIPFTDPVALARDCGIPHRLTPRKELTSDFTYQFIRRWGGPAAFYQQFFLTSISPVGFTRDGRNYNYYDDADLYAALRPFIIESFERQLEFGAERSVGIVIGSGANFAEISKLNRERHWFDKLLVVDHPRYVMQYRRNDLDDYLAQYQNTFERARGLSLAAGGAS